MGKGSCDFVATASFIGSVFDRSGIIIASQKAKSAEVMGTGTPVGFRPSSAQDLRIVQMHADQGDRVEAGQVLVRLDDSDSFNRSIADPPASAVDGDRFGDR
jgi:multidrug efflux pump subunit AcrA (membrane-fusion protein)